MSENQSALMLYYTHHRPSIYSCDMENCIYLDKYIYTNNFEDWLTEWESLEFYENPEVLKFGKNSLTMSEAFNFFYQCVSF